MWFKVRKNRVLHWPEYGPVFSDGAVGMAPGLVGRNDRVWALEDHYVEIEHPAIKWCVEGVNAQMNKLVQVTQEEVDDLSDAERHKRVRLSKDRPMPVRRLIDEWTRKLSASAPASPPSKATDDLVGATAASSSDVPAVDSPDEGEEDSTDE